MMASIWIVSEDPSLAGTLAFQLSELGEVASGRPERGAWKEASGPPDLLVPTELLPQVVAEALQVVRQERVRHRRHQDRGGRRQQHRHRQRPTRPPEGGVHVDGAFEPAREHR